MSSSIGYRPPPRYSKHVFNGKLRRIFSLQSQCRLLLSELKGIEIKDSKYKIHVNCSEFLNNISGQDTEVLKPFEMDFNGTFGQKTYNKLNNVIKDNVDKVQEFYNSLKAERERFASAELDFITYKNYRIFHDNCVDSFNAYKSNLLIYLKQIGDADSSKKLLPIFNRIKESSMTRAIIPFKIGFAKCFEDEKQKIRQVISQNENNLQQLRFEVIEKAQNDSIISLESSSIQFPGLDSGLASKLDNALLNKIKEIISEVSDVKRRQGYQHSFEELLNSQSLCDNYYYQELYDSILSQEKSAQIKSAIYNMLIELNKTECVEELHSERQKLIQSCNKYLAQKVVRNTAFELVQSKYKAFFAKKQKIENDKLIQEQEICFLKTQIVKYFEQLGYQVMTDLNVIDFTKEDEFFFRIPSQNNYCKVRFENDGTFAYNFLIPEAVDNLSSDQKKNKLIEMDRMCTKIKNIFSDLQKIGVNWSMIFDNPVTEHHLFQVPLHLRHLIPPTEDKASRKRASKFKYLNEKE